MYPPRFHVLHLRGGGYMYVIWGGGYIHVIAAFPRSTFMRRRIHVCEEEDTFVSSQRFHPQKSIDYAQRNRSKKDIYRSFVINSYNKITSGSSFNALVNSGIVHPAAVLNMSVYCCYSTTGANSGFGDFQWKSPFDTCPATRAPLSLIKPPIISCQIALISYQTALYLLSNRP